MAPAGDGEEGLRSPFDQGDYPPPFHRENCLPPNMSRPSIGIPSSMVGGEYSRLNRMEDRRTTLDPSTMNTMSHTRPETPVSGIPYSMIRRIKQKYNTGAKIVDAIKRAIEIKTGGDLTDEEINQLVDTLMSLDVHSFFLFH